MVAEEVSHTSSMGGEAASLMAREGQLRGRRGMMAAPEAKLPKMDARRRTAKYMMQAGRWLR